MDPLAAVGVLVAIVLILTLPRQKAIVPFLLAYFTIPLGQVLVVGGIHFIMLQILILTVVGRMIFFPGSASEGRFAGGFNGLDWAVVLWALSAFTIVSLQWMEMQATIKFLGDLIESLGGYLAVRFLIPDRDAVRRTVKVLAAICVIQGACMVSEQFTLHNVFGYVPEIRDGHVRSQGVLGALYGGVFAGVLIPLFIWLWTEGESQFAAFVGFAGATAMVLASHASTSLMAYGGGLLGLAFWPLRRMMRLVRWVFVAVLAGLQLAMHGPVWSLIEKVDLIPGSSSYHRYMLIDTLIRHFGEWWLLGTRNNGSWGWESWDTCNEFVAVAVTGGLLTLVLYITVLKRSFAAAGNARKRVEGDRQEEWFFWCLASSLFAHVVGQFGINYMAQLLLVLYPLLASISVSAIEARQATPRSVETVDGMQIAFPPGPAETGLPLSGAT